MRIVSLIASATEILHALDLGRYQVGRSHECDFPESVCALPVCTRPRFAVNGSSAEIDRLVKQTLTQATSVYEVFEDVLEALQPTHILTQTQCEVCAVSRDDVERAIAGRFSTSPQVVSLEPNALSDVWLDIRRVADACQEERRGADLVDRLQAGMTDISRRARESGLRPRVACIEWQEPLMAAGNWTPELVSMAGGEDLFGRAGAHSPWLTFEQLAAADPDAILVAPCGFDLDRTASEMYWLTKQPGWTSLRAVKEHRVFLGDGNQYFNRPGPRVLETLQILAETLHPGQFPPSLEGIAWRRID